MIYGEGILHDLLNNGADILKSFSCLKLETDINRFIEAQKYLISVVTNKRWKKSRTGRKPIIGFGISSHSLDVWDIVAEHITMG